MLIKSKQPCWIIDLFNNPVRLTLRRMCRGARRINICPKSMLLAYVAVPARLPRSLRLPRNDGIHTGLFPRSHAYAWECISMVWVTTQERGNQSELLNASMRLTLHRMCRGTRRINICTKSMLLAYVAVPARLPRSLRLSRNDGIHTGLLRN